MSVGEALWLLSIITAIDSLSNGGVCDIRTYLRLQLGKNSFHYLFPATVAQKEHQLASHPAARIGGNDLLTERMEA